MVPSIATTYYLEEIPQEMFVLIISQLSLSDLGNLSLTGSSRIKAKITDWIMSRSFLKKISSLLAMPLTSLTTEDGFGAWRKVTSEFGTLAKKLSMIHGTSYRLRLLSAWYSRLDALVRSGDGNGAWFRYLGSMGLASALDSFTIGWDVVEYDKILGWFREIEEDISEDIYFWQYLSSDQCRGTWTAFMLISFTKPGQTYQAASLLMCLFGPASCQLSPADHLQLSNYQQRVLHAKWRFDDLGMALSCLQSILSQSNLLTILITLFDNFVFESDSQGKFY